MKKYFFVILFFLVGLLACTRRPMSVISPSKMQNIMQDLYIAEAIHSSSYGGFKTEEEQEKLINSVLLKHDVTRAKLDSSLVWYSDNLDELNKINEAVGKSLIQLDTIYRNNSPAKIIHKFSDFTNLNIPSSFSLSHSISTLAFRIDSTKLYTNGSPINFELEFEVLGLDSLAQSLDSEIYYHYRDTLIRSKQSLENDSYTYKHHVDTTNRGYLQSIRGFIHLNDTIPSNHQVIISNIELKINRK